MAEGVIALLVLVVGSWCLYRLLARDADDEPAYEGDLVTFNKEQVAAIMSHIARTIGPVVTRRQEELDQLIARSCGCTECVAIIRDLFERTK